MSEEEIIEEVEEEETVDLEDDKGEETSSTPDEPDPKLAETVESLEKQISGLKQGISAERGKRQNVEGRLQQFSDIFAQARTARAQPALGPSNIPVEFDDEGNPYVSPAVISKIGASQNVGLQQKLAKMENHLVQSAHQNYMKQTLDSAVGVGNEKIYGNLKDGFAALDRALTGTIQNLGIANPKSIDEALNIIESQGIDKDFAKQFPNLDLESTIEAFTSPRKMKKAISMMSSVPTDGTKTVKKMQQLGASSHVGKSGVTGGAELTLDQISNLSNKDFEALSDAQIAKIDRLLEAEES